MKPGPALITAALAWAVLGAVGFFSDFVSLVWLYAGLSLLPIIVLDALVLFFLGDRFAVEREVRVSLAQDEWTRVRIIIRKENKLFLPYKILLWDLHPPSMVAAAPTATTTATTTAVPTASPTATAAAAPTATTTAAFPAVIDRLAFAAGEGLTFEYSLLPRERGLFFFRGLELLLSSPCRFWALKVFHSCASTVRVYPNFNKIKAAAGRDLRGLLERSGVKNIRMRGQGLEFNSLRDYQDGDSIRAVDWRATSRRRKVIIREYQEEQDQQLLFLLDSGYRLNRKESLTGRLQFDSALEAVLLLSWISLKHGDSVAVRSFGLNPSTRRINPRKGLSSFPALMNNLYDVKSSASPSSPFSALEDALSQLKRRTFIILISNFREEDRESLSWILKRVEKRHLLLLVSLKEQESEYLASRQPEGLDEALETAAAFSYQLSRRDLYKAWEHSGVLTLDTSARDLSAALINRYLSVKRSGRL
ncbi:MAG: DUF58 domain-containing protein [Treponema sp.]|nr:DUF58 domain-containing protein [Treponema sp.]